MISPDFDTTYYMFNTVIDVQIMGAYEKSIYTN